ncbi:MAG: hypothetical protein H6977_08365 [Gammaproteobacteria bacterium]|nr:hypothetical protein [Gammaproteobacteria bacterium]MCP5200013.1 hypothetical protein [Gammaproteobacteria bacterium]
MDPVDLLERIAATLRHDVGPAVGADYPRTQAYMASVVLGKLAGELRAQPAHSRAATAEADALYADLQAAARAGELPRAVVGAVEAAARERSDAHLGRLIEQLYAHRDALGVVRFAALLGRIRQALKARLARELEYSA